MNKKPFENVLLKVYRELPHEIVAGRAEIERSTAVLQRYRIPVAIPECATSQAIARIEYAVREYATKHWAWAIPNEEAISALVRHSPIVEIGAGTGYWARLASDAGADVVAYDLRPRPNRPVGDGSYYPVVYGGQMTVLQHPDRSLFLCWPPYESPMAFQCLAAYEGAEVIYVGEYGGRTADERFHKRLERDWVKIEKIRIPRWHGIHDQMYVFARKR